MTDRTMLCLPAIVGDGQQWSLPLVDATALALAGALVEDDPARRTAALATVLAADPALAIWSACRARETTPAVPHTIVELAGWLGPRLVSVLDWSSSATSITTTSIQHARYAALVAESVTAAAQATRALPREEVLAEPAYLLVLCWRWRQWFEAAGASEQPSGQCPPAPWPLPQPASGDESLSKEARTAGDEAWRRWLAEIPGVQALLPALVVQMRRTPVVQADFDRAVEKARLAALKELAYGAGHELNNPLANIASRAQTLLKEETNPERRRRLAAINTQAFRAHEMLADLMLFARPPQLAPEPVDLVRLADDVLAELAEDAAAQQTTLVRPGRREPLVIQADPVHLREALRAICQNSLEALGRGGTVTVDVQSQASQPGRPSEPGCPQPGVHGVANGAANSSAQIIVSDDGPGIPAEIRDKIFDPFFSGREAGRGLGFGLSKCWRIVTLHGGQIDVQSEPGRGTRFTITLLEQAAGYTKHRPPGIAESQVAQH